jgi:hypothetical protein
MTYKAKGQQAGTGFGKADHEGWDSVTGSGTVSMGAHFKSQ